MIHALRKSISVPGMPDGLEIIDLHAGHGEAAVLHGVTLVVDRGAISVVVGRNGVGKTTLIRTLIGLNPVRRGSIHLAGEDITCHAPESRARLGIGLVPQGRRLFPSLTVREHLMVGARPPTPGMSAWTPARVVRLFPRLAERMEHRGAMLSGGEQAMVAMARALVGNPRVLLLDEPTEGLSPLLVSDVGNVLRILRDEGVGVLLVEQNLGLAMSVADRIHVMSKGRIAYSGTAAELGAAPEIRARLLGLG
jgi:branched-chain amino acid transport system ATP-binding protein